MCGIFLVKSRSTIPLEEHLNAFIKLQNRGPDFFSYRHENNIFIGQSTLHITGSNEYYHTVHPTFLAYNGEIYNYKKFGNYSNDIELVADVVLRDLKKFTEFEGPWAWAWTNDSTVLYATDPQGERILYQYKDEEILIVSSEILPIIEFLGKVHCTVPYSNKCWTMLAQTPWHAITRIIPGTVYRDGYPERDIDNVWSWIKEPSCQNFDEAYEEFQSIWRDVCHDMTPACPAGLSYSGGIDSNLILNSVDNLSLYAVNTQGKDAIVDNIVEFLTAEEQSRLTVIDVDNRLWADKYRELIEWTQMPAQSWSFVGKWLVNEACQERVLFTGIAADELFGGYNIYKTLTYFAEGSTSPYSQCDHDNLWTRCLSAYNGQANQATLLMDYLYQVVGNDAPGADRIGGAHGIEIRNPFMHPRLIKFILNLPFEFKVNTVSKPLLRRLFLERWPEALLFPKMGFAGHANDSLPYMNVDITPTEDRHLDWKEISQKSFYEYTTPSRPVGTLVS